MECEVVTIGNELLLGFTLDTNGANIAQMLSGIGGRVARRVTVPDEPEAIRDAIQSALARTKFVICTGGLGPTRDDITKKTVADLFGMPLELDEAYLEQLRERFAKWRGGQPMPEANRTQAEIPRGATVLANRWGTAPGLWLTGAGGDVILLPGVPREMSGLMEHEVMPRLMERTGATRVTRSLTLRATGVSESALADQLDGVDEELAPVSLAYLPNLEGVDLRLTAWNVPGPEADVLLARRATMLRDRLGDVIYDGVDVAVVVLEGLRGRGWTLAVAESCTGGLLGARLTAIPGASDVFVAGLTTYTNQSKSALLGVSPETLGQFGAVSAETAREMAQGVARRMGTEAAIAVTGVAGPGGGTPEKPVGTVYIAVVAGGGVRDVRMVIPGSRAEIRARSTQAALNLLRLEIRSYLPS